MLEFRERFQINGEMISWEELGQITTEICAAVDAMEADGLYSRGRYRRGPVLVCPPRVRLCRSGNRPRRPLRCHQRRYARCAITCIGLDHTAILGGTVEKIADPHGKPGCIAVSYPAQPARAQRVVEGRSPAPGL